MTTVELRRRLAAVRPDVQVVGLEIAPERVTAAQPYAERLPKVLIHRNVPGEPVLDGPSRWRLGELTLDWSAVAPR